MLLTLDPSTVANDRSWFLDVNNWARHTGWLHDPFEIYAKYGIVLFAAFLGIGYVLARRSGEPRTMALALWTPLATLLAIALNQPLATHVNEQRPFVDFPNALVLVHRSADPSFASDHAVMAGAVALGLLFVSRRLGVIAVVAAIVMAFTRVYVGAHFPVDVVAGLLLGAAVTGGGWLALRPVLSRVVTASSRTRLRPLVTSRPR
jgi:undecaprenyl-diphosphatase